MNIRPLHDWVLVKMDPLVEVVGALVLPGGVDHRTATVLRVGPGTITRTGQCVPVPIAEGDRVVFNRAHGEHLQGKELRHVLGDDLLLIRPADILVTFTGTITVS